MNKDKRKNTEEVAPEFDHIKKKMICELKVEVYIVLFQNEGSYQKNHLKDEK